MASKLKKKRFRVKHQKVKLFRANEPLLSVFMWGVNHTINELSHVLPPIMLLPDDFRAYSKLKVDNHAFNKENIPSHFKVKEYCPLVFRNLRERFGIDEFDFKESLTRSQPISIDSQGKSGAKFYQSYNKLFIIKMLTSDEVEQMHFFLKHYHPYIVERHGKTLLPQYLAMYRLTVDKIEYYLVIMRNIFSHHLRLHRKYDLKGSTVDREASDKELEKDLPTLKDNDFMRDQTKIFIGEEAKTKLFNTLTADVDFLTRLNLMDYSLLVGIHDCVKAADELKSYNDTHPELSNDEDADPLSGNESEDSNNLVGDNGHAHNAYLKLWKYGVYNSPPESPRATNDSFFYRDMSCQLEEGSIIPELDIYAIPTSDESPKKEIYFIAIIDVLTHYGVKKQAAKAAKTVKYGSHVDGISTCDPDQYAKRFIDFISKSIE